MMADIKEYQSILALNGHCRAYTLLHALHRMQQEFSAEVAAGNLCTG